MANISFGQNILPKVNNTYSLGNSSYKWHAYLADINGQAIEDLVLPAVTSTDNGKILGVNEGSWSVITPDDSTWDGIVIKKSNVASGINDLFAMVRSGYSSTDTINLRMTMTPQAFSGVRYDDNGYLKSTTPSSDDNSTKVATTAFVQTAISGLGSGGGSGLPSVSSTDNGKILQVSSGAWSIVTPNFLTSHQDISGKANSADLATVATTGSYNDLLNKPDLSSYLTSVPTMTGATSSAAGTTGLVPAPTSADVDKFLAGDGTYKSGGLPMVILSYGSSTWTDFINAYNNNVIVYCRASSNANPASGSQTRMAFMAYVNNATTPTNVEFQYYRSVSSHSATQMGDQVFVYKLDKTSGWSVTTREASIKEIKAGTNQKIGISWSSNVVTLSNTMTAADMPMSSSDATKVDSAISTLSEHFANFIPNNGNDGQLLKSNGDGTAEWANEGTPSDEQVETAVSTWLTAHPEATTTVQDGAISRAKLDADLKAKTDAVPDLKSAFEAAVPVKRIDDEQANTQKNVFTDAFIPLVLTKGQYFGNTGYQSHAKGSTSQVLQAGVYMFPAPPTGFKFNVYRYISDSSGSQIQGDTTTAVTLNISYPFVISVFNINDYITYSDIETIENSFIPLVENSGKSIVGDANERITSLELDAFKSSQYPNLFENGRFDTNGFTKPFSTTLVSTIRYPAGLYSISCSDSDYDFNIVSYNSDSSGTVEYAYSSTAKTNIYLDKPFYINIRKDNTTAITPNEKRLMCNAMTVTRTIPDKIPVTFCSGYSTDVLAEFYVPPTSPIYNTQWKFYRVGAEAADFRIGIILADESSTLAINGFDVNAEYYSDKVQAFSYGGNVLAYYVLHFTGTDYYRTTTSGAAYATAVNDLNNSPRIKEYLSREENLVLMGDSIFGYYYENMLEPILGSISSKRVFNCGFGGLTMAWRSQDGTHVLDPLTFSNLADAIATGSYTTQQAVIGQDVGYPARVASIKTIDWSKPTTVIVDYINNDMAMALPIGNVWEDGETPTDWDRSTVLGAMTYGIQKIMSVYPHVRFIFCTPIWRYINNTMIWDYVNESGKTAQDYREAMLNNSKQIGVSCFDLILKSGRNPWNMSTYQLDGSHWNVAGYAKFARQLNAIDEGSLN